MPEGTKVLKSLTTRVLESIAEMRKSITEVLGKEVLQKYQKVSQKLRQKNQKQCKVLMKRQKNILNENQ